MATHLCQKCKQAHPGRVCYYDEKGECAETIGVNEVAETCNEPSKDEEGGSLLRSKYAPFYDKGRAEDDSSPRLASAPKFQKLKERANSGSCWIYADEQRHFHGDHHFQQRGRVTNASRDGDECV